MRLTDARERRIERLKEATGENSKSGAIDVAAKYYLHMGETDVGHRVGAVNDLMSAAAERGSLTAPEIAEILDCDELPVQASTSYNVGRDGSR
jgi:hypothetical protein